VKIINNGRNKSERGRDYEAGRENGRPGDLETWIPNEISPAAIDFIT